jgi:hypothetical protein
VGGRRGHGSDPRVPDANHPLSRQPQSHATAAGRLPSPPQLHEKWRARPVHTLGVLSERGHSTVRGPTASCTGGSGSTSNARPYSRPRGSLNPPSVSGCARSGCRRRLRVGDAQRAVQSRPGRRTSSAAGAPIPVLQVSVRRRLAASACLFRFLGRRITGARRLLAFALLPILASAQLCGLLVCQGVLPS